MDESTITKMQLHYWETKQQFLKKIIKRKEDDFLVASDAELDAKLELLKSIDETNQNLLQLFELYQENVCTLAQEECILGRFLRECSKHDQTKAGNLMSSSGKTFLFAGHQFIMLRNILIRSYRDIQTFQYRAVIDTFETVEQMEKQRTAYRAALLWMKDYSNKQLNDPDQWNQLDKFKKIQNHVREKKKLFEKLKLDSIQKIDLLSASRCNLFSNILLQYQNTLKSVWFKTKKTMEIFIDTFKSHLSYEFQMLKELNQTSTDSNGANNDEAMLSFEKKLKEILKQQNTNELDMLIFFEADYTDEKIDNNENNQKENLKDSSKPSNESTSSSSNKKSKSKKQQDDSNKTSKKSKKSSSSSNKNQSNSSKALLDLDFDSKTEPIHQQLDNYVNDNYFNKLNSFKSLTSTTSATSTSTASDLIDLDLALKSISINNNDNSSKNKDNGFIIDKLLSSSNPISNSNNTIQMATATSTSSSSIETKQQQPSKPAESNESLKNSEKNPSMMDTWLNLFSEIDPLSNPEEFEKRFSQINSNQTDNC